MLNYSRKIIFSIFALLLLGSASLAYAAVGDFILSFDGTGGTPFSDLEKIAVDNNDRIIVVDNDTPNVQIFDSTGSFVVALSGGTAFSDPQGAAVDSNNLIYVIDSGLVQVYDSTGAFTGTSFDGSEGLGTQFVNVRGIAIDSNNRIIVVGPDPDLVQIYSTSGTFLDSFDGTGGTTFNFAEAVAVDSNNRIIVGDSANNNVQIFDSSGTFVVALSGATTPTPNAIAVYDNDRILVAENGNNLVQIYASTGTFQSSIDGSEGLGTQFASIEGIAVDSNNRIIVADVDLVQIYEGFPVASGAVGDFIFTFPGTGVGGGGTAFSSTSGIAVDSNNRIIVLESGSGSLVQVYSSAGVFDFSFTGDEFGGGIAWSSPQEIATDSNNRIIVWDNPPNTIQVYDSTGAFVFYL